MNTTTAFLIRSERNVIDHCRRLLAQDGLSEPEVQRLQALVATAQAELELLIAGGNANARAA